MNEKGPMHYQELVHRLRAVVRRELPSDASVIVISKGDDEMLQLDGRRAWHFLQRDDGVYAGYYPSDSAAAIAHLNTLRHKGGQYLVIPAPSLWWLDHYSEFSQHLEKECQLVVNEEGVGLIYALHNTAFGQQPETNGKSLSVTLTDIVSTRQRLNEKIKTVAGNDWLHRFALDDGGEFVPADNVKYRFSVLRQLFGSLFKNQTVLVLNEGSGLYPVMIKRAGAAAVTANNMSRDRCDLMRELSSFTGVAFEILDQSLMIFDGSQIYVDLDHAESHNFLFAQNVIWGLFNAAGQNFSDVVEACTHYVRDGLVFDWTNAEWANPKPPAHYNRENMLEALRERFEYVFAGNDWLILALGKLPVEEEVGKNGESAST
jgi:hypothetical protein